MTMTATFGFQLHELIVEPEFQSFAPTFEYDERFDVDYLHSMVAVEIRGRSEGTSKELTDEEIIKDLRVSFLVSNGSYLDAVFCTDLYADQIQQAEESDSARAKDLAALFRARSFICPNVTSFDFLKKETVMKIQIKDCQNGVQGVYAGDVECNEPRSQPISNYKY